MKKNGLLGSTISLALGALLMIGSSSGNSGGLSSNFLTGNMMIFGSLAYIARRKQNQFSSIKWKITEIVSIVIILYFTFMGIVSGGWYTKPMPLFIAPIWIAIAYIIALKNRKKMTKNSTIRK